MSRRGLFVIAGPVLLGLALGPAARGQELTLVGKTSHKESKKSRDRKVWMNEDVAVLGTPGDMYSEPKRSPEQAAKSGDEATLKIAADAKAAPKQAPAPAFIPPGTLAEAEKRIAQKNEEIRQKVERIETRRKEFFTAPDYDAIQVLAKKMEPAMRELNEAQAQLKKLEAAREELLSRPQPPAPNRI
jgi:guanylate kinase